MSAPAKNTASFPSPNSAHKNSTKTLSAVWQLLRPRRWLLLGSLFLIIVDRFCSLALPISSRYLVNDVMVARHFAQLPPLLASVAAATFAHALITYILSRQLYSAGQNLIAELRLRLQRHIARLPVSFYDANRTGTLVSRIMTDVEGLRHFLGDGLLDLAGGILTAFIALFFLLRISILMTILAIAILLAFGLFLKKVFGILRPLTRERSRLHAEVTGRLTESLAGVRVVKGYHAEESEARVFQTGIARLLANLTRSISAQAFMSFCSVLALGLVGILIMYLGAREVSAQRLDVGSFVEFILLLGFLAAPVGLLVSVATQLTEALAGLDRTTEILNMPVEDHDPARTRNIEPILGHVAFQNVSFAYSPGQPVLHNISFTAAPGTVTALVGSSGSGKSTIISLLCAFHSANSGQVLIDGVDLATLQLSCYRSQLGVVLQETFLFDGTIRENILFSRPHATPEQFLHACRLACVDEFAARFPDGYATLVGERGVKLSGGQRQRLSIARALLANPRILILDEATSSLDSESEAMIQSSLGYLLAGRTTFVIAHRLSTIRRADQILVIEQGSIVESGTHDSLHRLGGRYYDLYTRQQGLDSNLFLAPGEGGEILNSTVPEN